MVTTTEAQNSSNGKKKKNVWLTIYRAFLALIATGILSSSFINYYYIHYHHHHNDELSQQRPPSRRTVARHNNEAKHSKGDYKAQKTNPGSIKHTKEHQRLKRLLVEKYIQNQIQFKKKSSDEVILEKSGAFMKKLFVHLDDSSSDTRDSGRAQTATTSNEPWFVLHIGPPKTATTTIQCGLEKHALRLAKTDGYHFLGGGCGEAMMKYYMPNGEETVLRQMLIRGLQDMPGAVDHLSKFVARAKVLRETYRKSVILSGELFGSKLSFHPTVMRKTRDMLISNAGFSPDRVRIVLAYRHFVDWLPSFHYQTFVSSEKLMDKHWFTLGPSKAKVVPFLEYADKYLKNWEEFQRTIESDPEANYGLADFPLSRFPQDRQSIHPSWWLYRLWSHYFPLENQVQVYDMHSPMNSNRPNDDMTTDFICHMLPDANRTCARLIFLEDERRLGKNGSLHRDEIGKTTEPDYDTLELHSRFSYLSPNRKGPTFGVGNASQTIEDGNNNKGGGKVAVATTTRNLANQAMNARPSSDHHAEIIVETLLIRGDIPAFAYSDYGPSYFENATKMRVADVTSPETVNGYTKGKLVIIAKQLLQQYGIAVNLPSSNKYFDCMPKDLEERFLNASKTFMDLVYKHTPMLSLATASTRHSQTTAAASDASTTRTHASNEKEERWIQARAEHTRLFEYKKSQGKYCDINPDKVFSKLPVVFNSLISLSYKPTFRSFAYDDLPKSMLKHLETLGYSKKDWDGGGKRVRLPNPKWEALSPNQKAAAFALGWTEKTWSLAA